MSDRTAIRRRGGRRPRRAAARRSPRPGAAAAHPGMTCRDRVEALSGYVDGDLGAALRHTIEEHGGRCPPCRAFIRTLQATVRAVRSLPRAPLPAAQRDALIAALRAALRL